MKRKHNRAGMSVAELCVVLAVLSIVGTLVVSFSAMVNARASASATKLNAAEDLKMSQTILDAWADHMAGLDAQFTAGDTGLSAIAGGEVYQVTLEDGVLRAALPEGQQLACPVSTAEEFRFQQMTRPGGNPLIFCTLVYSVNNPAGTDIVMEETFTILSRVGEAVS